MAECSVTGKGFAVNASIIAADARRQRDVENLSLEPGAWPPTPAMARRRCWPSLSKSVGSSRTSRCLTGQPAQTVCCPVPTIVMRAT